jgi:hypothetical protein
MTPGKVTALDRHLEHQTPLPFTSTKTADETLDSLATYLGKLGTGHPVARQD